MEQIKERNNNDYEYNNSVSILDLIIVCCTLISFTNMSNNLPNFINKYQEFFSLYSILAIFNMLGRSLRKAICILICIIHASLIKTFSITIIERNNQHLDIRIKYIK